MFFLISLVVMISSGQLAMAQSYTATEIIKLSEDRMRGKTLQGQMIIKTVRPSYTREMELKI